MSQQLTVVERNELRTHESIIAKHIGSFVEVGAALKAIRDKGLYRESFKTFEKYVDTKWGLARSRAYQYIDAVEIKEDLSTIVDKTPRASEIVNEAQMRQLVDVPTESIQEVVEKAAEIAGDERITAKVLHEAKQEIFGESKPEPAQPKPQKQTGSDPVIARARQKLEEHLRGVILQFGHLGLGGKADSEVTALRKKAGL